MSGARVESCLATHVLSGHCIQCSGLGIHLQHLLADLLFLTGHVLAHPLEKHSLSRSVGSGYRGCEWIKIPTRLPPEGVEGVLSALLVASLLLVLGLLLSLACLFLRV